jgi:hypothetical protein
MVNSHAQRFLKRAGEGACSTFPGWIFTVKCQARLTAEAPRLSPGFFFLKNSSEATLGWGGRLWPPSVPAGT